MKYSTVIIRPKAFNEPGWDVYFEDLIGDRKDEATRPNALGFYHYPTYLGRKAAFEALRDCMCRRHEQDIKALTLSLRSLKDLTYGSVT